MVIKLRVKLQKYQELHHSETWTLRTSRTSLIQKTVANLEEKDIFPQQKWKTMDDLRLMEQ